MLKLTFITILFLTLFPIFLIFVILKGIYNGLLEGLNQVKFETGVALSYIKLEYLCARFGELKAHKITFYQTFNKNFGDEMTFKQYLNNPHNWQRWWYIKKQYGGIKND